MHPIFGNSSGKHLDIVGVALSAPVHLGQSERSHGHICVRAVAAAITDGHCDGDAVNGSVGRNQLITYS